MLSIRLATINDLDELVKLRVIFLDELEPFTSKQIYQETLDKTRDYFTRKISSNELQIWIAEDNNKIISTGSLSTIEMPPTSSHFGGGCMEGYIFNMYTLAAYRKRGLATTILQKMLQYAKDNNYSRVWLMCSDEYAMGVYAKLNFKKRNDVMDYTF